MWDMRLIAGLYTMEAYEVDGRPQWLLESPAIAWTAKKHVSPARAAEEAAQERFQESKSKEKGVSFYAVPTLRKGKKWPTRMEWIESKKKKGSPGEPESGDDKLEKRRVDAEERAKQKMREMGKDVE